MQFTCSAEGRQKDARGYAKLFFLLRPRHHHADGASLGCTTNFALDVYFALQFYYLKLILAPLKVLKASHKVYYLTCSGCKLFSDNKFT